MSDEFFTFREYMKKDDSLLTASMEDYLEMIYRLSRRNGFTRVNDLAAALNVQPPSATKMVQKLADVGVVNYEKYGIILLSKKGKKQGQALLERHQIIEDFLNLLGISGDVLEETEKIEHTISTQTLDCLADFVAFFENRPEIVREFHAYRKTKGEP
ncbi:transcriptional regulator MntR [Pelotomaculum terephthalicicum JT]|uniref:transcriptional regulator MntR n=1 Tax=Pelotomaculum terephthalicicum TaxID=206393 RepID=UPI0009C804A9|nr:transcriptional regulator MntR [Pelotomaculum terephthalicicum]MCG9966764.1 transcriptional regulator MntR [Pelotomaculum terephthalicicum JT]OPY60091.1 MAG: Transcriptional regulator MntR [Pelotomaculum sp. PtaU1.Bin065]